MMELSRETVAGVIGAVIAVLLQITVAPAITLFEAVPNFIVAFCIVRAVAAPAASGSVMPLVLGLLFDLMGGGYSISEGMDAVFTVAGFDAAQTDALPFPDILALHKAIVNETFGVAEEEKN